MGAEEGGWFPRAMTQGRICVLGTRICRSVLNTYVKGYGQMVKIDRDDDWEDWKTRYDLRASTRQRVNMSIPGSTF